MSTQLSYALDEKQTEHMKQLLGLLDPNRLTRQEFESTTKRLIELVIQNQKQVQEAVARLEQLYSGLFNKIQNHTATSLDDIKNQTNQLFVERRLNDIHMGIKNAAVEHRASIEKTVSQKLKEVDARISKVKDGYTPVKGKDYFDGMPGVPGKSVDMNKIKKIEDDILMIKKLPRGRMGSRMGMRKVPIVTSVDLTASVNGIATTFTLPQDTVKVLGVWSSQFPVTFRQDVDWTFAGRTLTLVQNQVGIPASGQTLWALIETLFYA